MSESLTIRKIIDKITSGEIRVPAFQRGFVWTPQQVAFLLDSIYKDFPIGTVFLWKTDEKLKVEKSLGNFTIPDPKKDHPIYYVLDGQQRLTSLFSVFQTELTAENNYEWLDIFFDLDADKNIQESQFVALKEAEVSPTKHFPMKSFFNSPEYFNIAKVLSEKQQETITKVYERFLEFALPIQIIETEEKENVAIVFERINRSGTELDTFQLLSAWSWSSEFDLQEEFTELASEIAPFGFGNISQDKDLQLKCCSGVIVGEASPNSIVSLKGEDVRNNFDKIKNGIKGSIDFLRNELDIFSLDWLPYPSMMVSLTRFFATNAINGRLYTDKQRKQLIKWFWKSNFSRRYTGGITDKHKQDIKSMDALIESEDCEISQFPCEIDPLFFKNNQFNVGAVNTKTFIMMLASNNPKSFISGANVNLNDVLKNVSRNEFHHIFPKKYLENLDKPYKEINWLANFCFLNNADNQKIKDKAPEIYKYLINADDLQEILKSAICPVNALDLKYDVFVDERVKTLVEYAKKLIS